MRYAFRDVVREDGVVGTLVVDGDKQTFVARMADESDQRLGWCSAPAGYVSVVIDYQWLSRVFGEVPT